MNRDTKIIVGVILLLAIVLVAVGYAAISNIQLNITGDVQATPEQTNFVVEFSGTPTTSDDTKVTAELNQSDPLKATMNVTGLSAAGDTVTATYTIENKSPDLSAALSATETNSNTEYFEVSHNIAEPSTIDAGETTTITVTVKLIKTPVDTDETTSIGVTITAEPEQP